MRLSLLLVAASALLGQEERRDRAGTLDEFGWEGRAVRTRDRDVQFSLRREAQVMVIQVFDDGPVALVGTGRFEAGRHTIETPAPARLDPTRVPFVVSCPGGTPCPPPGRTPPPAPPVRQVQTYLVIATDSSLSAAEIETRLSGLMMPHRDSAVRALPRVLFPGRSSGWASILVRR